MQAYRAVNGSVKFAAGQKMTVTAKQIADRRHCLDVPKDWNGKDPVAVVTTAPVEFKVGEVIGLPDLDRYTANLMVPLGAPKSDMDKVALDKDAVRQATAKAAGKPAAAKTGHTKAA